MKHDITGIPFCSHSLYFIHRLALWAAVFTIGLIGSSPSYAQTFTDYTPTGFVLPFLKQGQYILYLSSTRYDSERTSTSVPTASGRINDATTTFNITGYLGATDKLTMRMSLFLMPNDTFSRSSTFPNSGTQLNQDSNFRINPYFVATYRFTDNMQVFFVGDFEKYKLDETFSDIFPGSIQTVDTVVDRRDFLIRGGFVLRGGF